MLSELWRQYKHEDNYDAREELILKCLPMVKALAQRFSTYASPCYDTDDLISMGIIGLLDALEKYDPEMRASFRTYAKYRIRGRILDEIRDLQWTPRSIQEKIQILKKTYAKLEQKLSRTPYEEEAAKAMDMNLEQFRKMLVQIGSSTIVKLAQERSLDDDQDSYNLTLKDPNAICPIDEIISRETKSTLTKAIKNLPEREALVITLYYYEEITMKEIGKVLSLTESRICQIHSDAILHLMQALTSDDERHLERIRQPQEAITSS